MPDSATTLTLTMQLQKPFIFDLAIAWVWENVIKIVRIRVIFSIEQNIFWYTVDIKNEMAKGLCICILMLAVIAQKCQYTFCRRILIMCQIIQTHTQHAIADVLNECFLINLNQSLGNAAMSNESGAIYKHLG